MLQSLKLSLLLLILLCVVYTLILLGFAQVIAPNHGEGSVIHYTNNANGDSSYGFYNIGQDFTQDKYFWGRPSASYYNAMSPSASQLSMTDSAYLDTLKIRAAYFLSKNPTVSLKDIPAELITASGSGLDPDIRVESALIQAKRVASARGISIDKVNKLIEDNTSKPWLGLFGIPTINVLKLNVQLDALKS
ncbi:MAG: potassium-transporting ATPase subunit C [Phycisphaerales bacterium]|nr:potassium-transporting ATPase subunit C [Phycisphaerales bacterium]